MLTTPAPFNSIASSRCVRAEPSALRSPLYSTTSSSTMFTNSSCAVGGGGGRLRVALRCARRAAAAARAGGVRCAGTHKAAQRAHKLALVLHDHPQPRAHAFVDELQRKQPRRRGGGRRRGVGSRGRGSGAAGAHRRHARTAGAEKRNQSQENKQVRGGRATRQAWAVCRASATGMQVRDIEGIDSAHFVRLGVTEALRGSPPPAPRRSRAGSPTSPTPSHAWFARVHSTHRSARVRLQRRLVGAIVPFVLRS